MGRLNFAGPLGLSIAAALPSPVFADIGVPSAARMVHEAGLIVMGTVNPSATPALTASRVLKGNIGGQRVLVLADPSGGRFLSFSLARVPELLGTAPTLALGKFDGSRASLSLTWQNASFWPQGHRYDTFDSATLESTLAFLERLLAYSTSAAQDPDATVRRLVADIAGPFAQSALAYLEVAVQSDFGAQTAAQIRAICLLALERSTPDAASVRQFSDITPLFPVTLAAPLALRYSDTAQGDDASRLRQAIRAMLSARGAQLAAQADSDEMREAYKALAATLRRADARRLVAVFDASLPSLRDTYADALMAELVGSVPAESLKGLSAAQRKAIWRREIDALPD